MLFEKKRHTGDCSVTERFPAIFAKPLIRLIRHNILDVNENGKFDDTARNRKRLQSS